MASLSSRATRRGKELFVPCLTGSIVRSGRHELKPTKQTHTGPSRFDHGIWQSTTSLSFHQKEAACSSLKPSSAGFDRHGPNLIPPSLDLSIATQLLTIWHHWHHTQYKRYSCSGADYKVAIYVGHYSITEVVAQVHQCISI